MMQDLSSNPFVGLRPFQPDESVLFFGRREQTLELMQKLYETRFLSVVGSSGCGKSSLIRAGLIPKLKGGFLVEDRDSWFIATMKPGDRPLYNLAASLGDVLAEEQKGFDALAFVENLRAAGARAVFEQVSSRLKKSNANLLLLVDQFEEIFRFEKSGGHDGLLEEAADFVSIMLNLVKQQSLPIYTVMTIRSDFIGDCDAFFGLPEAMNRSQYLVPRLTRQQRREVIEGPIRLYGGSIEHSFLDHLLNTADETSDQLPVLQHAMMRTWDCAAQESDRYLDITAYEIAGTINNALSLHADEAMKGMDDLKCELTKKIFQALTDIDASNRRVRRPVHLSTLQAVTGSNTENIMDIIKRFQTGGRSFLVVSEDKDIADPVVDISHESLIRQWQTLKTWVEEEAASGQIYRRFAERAIEYYAGREELLRGVGLQQNWDWYRKHQPNEAWSVRYHPEYTKAIRFLYESRQKSEADEAEEKERQRRKDERQRRELEQARVLAEERKNRIAMQAKAAKRLKAGIIFVTIFGILSLLVGLVAYRLSQLAENRQRISRSRQLAMYATLNLDRGRRDPTLSFRLAEAALKSESTPLARKSIAFSLEFPLHDVLAGHNDKVYRAVFSPDGQKIVTASRDKTARIWDAANCHLLHELTGHTDWVYRAVFSPDSQKIVTASKDKTARIWNVANGRLLHELAGHSGLVYRAVFSPDGQKIVTASKDKTARIWDAANGQLLHELTGHTDWVYRATFSPDGQKIVTASRDKTARIWEAQSGDQLHELSGHEKGVHTAVFSPDGQMIVTASKDDTARIWDVQSGDQLHELSGHLGRVYRAVFSPDGQKIVTASMDRTARIWDVASGKKLQELKGHKGWVYRAVFSPDSQNILTASDDRTARIWNVSNGGQLHELRGHQNTVYSAVFSPDGQNIVTASADRTARTWNITNAGQLHELSGHEKGVSSAVFSSDGQMIVTASEDNTARIWDAQSGDQLHELRGHQSSVFSAVFSPVGQKIVTESHDRAARIWDAASGRQLDELKEYQTTGAWSTSFSPDGQKIVTASADGTAQIWDVASGKKLPELKGHMAPIYRAVFSPDGQKIATASHDKTARIWDAESGRQLQKLEGHRSLVFSAVFSPDSQRIATVSHDQTARIWDVASGDQLLELRGHQSFLSSAVFSPDGNKIVTASGDDTARIWDVASGKQLHELRGHQGSVDSAVFSPDGQKIATASRDWTARVWDVVSGEQLFKLWGHQGPVVRAAFSPDGQKIVTASNDGTARIWLTDFEKIVNAINIDKIRGTVRQLTEEEKKEFGF